MKIPLFPHSRVSFSSPNPLCIFSLVKMKAVGASTCFGFWGILKNPTLRFTGKLNQCFLWSLRSHSWSLGVCFHFHFKKGCPKVALLHFLEYWCLKLLSVEAFVRLVYSQFGQQLTVLNFFFFRFMGRVITLEAHGFDISADVWNFAKDAYDSIF